MFFYIIISSKEGFFQGKSYLIQITSKNSLIVNIEIPHVMLYQVTSYLLSQTDIRITPQM